MSEFFEASRDYLFQMNYLEFIGMIAGFLAVIFLIKENVWTWPLGLIYVVCSFVIFWNAGLFADFVLHIFFFVLNAYGWWVWVKKPTKREEEVVIATTKSSTLLLLWSISIPCIFVMGYVLSFFPESSLPYWDSATTTLSLFGMWLTARKKIENWHFWLVVDILATGIYFYKGLYFYSLLYFVYIGMAVAGFIEWKKLMRSQVAISTNN